SAHRVAAPAHSLAVAPSPRAPGLSRPVRPRRRPKPIPGPGPRLVPAVRPQIVSLPAVKPKPTPASTPTPVAESAAPAPEPRSAPRGSPAADALLLADVPGDRELVVRVAAGDDLVVGAEDEGGSARVVPADRTVREAGARRAEAGIGRPVLRPPADRELVPRE